MISEDDLEELRERLERRVMEAVEFADNSPEPPLESLYDHLYVVGDQVPGWYAVDERTPEPHRGEEEREVGTEGEARKLAEAGAAYAGQESPQGPQARQATDDRDAAEALEDEDDDEIRREAGVPVIRMREALNQALAEEMRRDESVFIMGEDVGVFQGAFKVTEGLLDEFGEKRVRDTPISENTIVGTGVGAAMAGLRPVVELMTVNFALLAMDQIVNHMAAIPYMFNGQVRVPLVVRMPGGGGHQLGPTHSHSLEAMFQQIPGLLVASPSTPADGKGLLKAAIRDDNPVIFIEHETLYGMRGEVPDDDGDEQIVKFGEAAVLREGTT